MLPQFVRRTYSRLKRNLWQLPLTGVPGPFRIEAKRDGDLAAEITAYERSAGLAHGAGSLPLRTLLRMEQLLPEGEISSVETGCGKSTILFSRISKKHRVFCLDDRDAGASSSVGYFLDCPATRKETLDIVYGPTQATLPLFTGHEPYDLVLIDGPHGFPFPELEYYYFYPHLKPGGLLALDDIHIASIGRLADFIAEDDMFELVECVGATAIFRRTAAPVFDPFGDGWWEQGFNRRRADFNRDVHLLDGRRRKPFSFEGRF
jgi:predicted O-methyltransferase YrrM